MKFVNEMEKRHAAAAVSRKFGVPEGDVVFVRDGYELVRYLACCAEQCRSRAAAIYPETERPALSRAVADSLNGTRPVLLDRLVRPIRCSYLQMPGPYGGLMAELEYVCTGHEHARRMAAMEAALAAAAAHIRAAAGGPRAPDWARAYAVVEYAVRHWSYSDNGVWSYTPYGALVDHEAVCMGISLAVQMLMKEMGVPCLYLRGYRRGDDTIGHAWNVIYCGGWFHLDVTDAVVARDPLRFWGVTALTDRSLEPGLALPGPLRCPCPAEFIKQNRKGTML